MNKHVMIPMPEMTPRSRAEAQSAYNRKLRDERESEQKDRATCRFCKAEECREICNAFYACKECGKVQ